MLKGGRLRGQHTWACACAARFPRTGSSVVAHASFPQGSAAECPIRRGDAGSRPHLPALPTCERTHTPLGPLLCRGVTWGARRKWTETGWFPTIPLPWCECFHESGRTEIVSGKDVNRCSLSQEEKSQGCPVSLSCYHGRESSPAQNIYSIESCKQFLFLYFMNWS